MVNIDFTRNERRLFDIISEREGRQIEIQEIAQDFYSDRAEWPKNWRGSIAAQMRSMAVKAYALGLGRVERVSRLGVNSTSVYSFSSRDGVEP